VATLNHREIDAGFRSPGAGAAVIAAISPFARSGFGRSGFLFRQRWRFIRGRIDDAHRPSNG
jgi:hypothetical protein